MENEIEKSFNDLKNKLKEDGTNKGSKRPIKYIVFIILLLIVILVLFVLLVLLYLYFNSKTKIEKCEDKKDERTGNEEEYLLEINGFKEKWYDIYGERQINLSYVENNIIPNSFKKDGSNYIEELGEINEGKDYSPHDVNVYDLYIPYSSLDRKDKHNGIILFVHGGGFENNTKEETEGFAVRFAKFGFITANIEYSNCLDKYKEKSFFRILDEINACVKNIKKELKKREFDDTKLELSLYGISAGGQLILLYAFNYKNKEIEIKYLMNSVGVVTLNFKDWLKPAIPNITLDSIENIEEIKQAKADKTVVEIDPSFILRTMNSMAGKKYSQKEIDELILNGVVQTQDERYLDIYKYTKYGEPINMIGNSSLPMLCLYGGNDDLVGIGHYSLLKKAYNENGAEKNIELIYMKYAGHERFHHFIERDIIAMKEMHKKMVEYGKKYFTWD